MIEAVAAAPTPPPPVIVIVGGVVYPAPEFVTEILSTEVTSPLVFKKLSAVGTSPI